MQHVRLAMVLVVALAMSAGGSPRAAMTTGPDGLGDAQSTQKEGRSAARPASFGRDRSAPQSPRKQPDEVEKLRRDLVATERDVRDQAVVALLGRREVEAHAALQEALRRGDDDGGTTRFILRSLALALSSPTHPVFGDERLRPVLLRDYVPVLVSYFAASEAPERAEDVQDLVLKCLRGLSVPERRDRFDELVAGADRELARATLSAASGCRDLSLAPWLARQFDDAELGDAARDALATLTFTPGFADRAAFEDWYDRNRGRSYTDLAESKARRGDAEVAALRSEYEVGFVRQTARLVAAMARTDSPDWAAIQAEVLDPKPAGRVQTCLESLVAAVEPRAIGGGRLGGVLQDRQAFVADLLTRLAAGPAVEERAVLLEVIAYLAVVEDAAQWAEIETALLGCLSSEQSEPTLRMAALRGLRRFESAANRRHVVELALSALSAHDLATLTAALACLREGGYKAPDSSDDDAADWLLLLKRVLTEPDIDLAQRELALEVATLHDGDEELVSRVFGLLVSVLRSADADVSLRKQVLPRLWPFTRDASRAEEYVLRIVDLLEDSSPELRERAAGQLQILPEASQTQVSEWNLSILMRAGDRVLTEPDPRVVSALCDLLLHVAEDPRSTSEVVGRLKHAALTLVEDQRPEDAFRRDILADALRVIGVGLDRDPTIWVAAGQGLAVLEARDGLRSVLERQRVEKLSDLEQPGVREAFELVIEAARLAPNDPPWSERLLEAEQLRIAFERLEAAGERLDAPGDRVLRLSALAALGNWDAVLDRGVADLDGRAEPLENGDRAAALLTVARAHCARGELPAAAGRLAEFEALGDSDSDAALWAWTTLAQHYVDADQPAAAVPILTKVLDKTAADAPLWRTRFLLSVTARLAADPASREALLEELRSHEARFAGEDVPADQATRYAELREQAGDRGAVAPGR